MPSARTRTLGVDDSLGSPPRLPFVAELDGICEFGLAESQNSLGKRRRASHRGDHRAASPRRAIVLLALIELFSKYMVDIHCHLLPNLDDGAETMEIASAMAEMAIAE